MDRAQRRGVGRWVFLLLLSSLSCGKEEEKVVAEVGDRSITVEDYDRMAGELLKGRFRGKEVTRELKEEMLEVMISKELFVAEALKRGLGGGEDVRRRLESLRRRLMKKRFYEDIVGEVEVNDEEVERKFREGFEEEVRTSHILCDSEEDAWEVLEELKGGASFEELAEERSLHPPSARRRGDMGYLPKALFLPELRDSIWDLEVGEVFPRPLRSRYGFHVVKLTGRRKVELGPRRAYIADMVRREKREGKFSAYLSDLEERYHLVCEGGTLRLLLERGRKAKDRVPEVGEAEGGMTLFRWRGGELKVSEYVEALSQVPFWERPVPTDSSAVRAFGERLAGDRIFLAEAEARGYGRKVEPQVRRLRERFAAEKLYRMEVEDRSHVTEEDIEKFYRENEERFRVPPTVVIREILVRTRSEADGLLRRIRNGEDMASLARRYSIREDTRERGGMTRPLTEDDPQFGKIARMALKAKVGQLIGPVDVPGGFSVFRILRKEPGRMRSLSEVRGRVWPFVRARKQEEVLAKFLDSLRTAYRVEVHEEALRFVLRNRHPEAGSGAE